MAPDVSFYQEELKITAFRILKDQSLAEDMVQDTFLYALENNITDKDQLIENVRKRALKLFGDRKRGPDTPQSGFYDPSDGENEDPIWRKVSAPSAELAMVVEEDINKAISSITTFKGQYLPFAQAREYVHTLHLPHGNAWKKYKRDHPELKIPIHAKLVYKEEWKGWRDFLGTTYYTFDEFVNYVRTCLVPRGIDNSARWAENITTFPPYIPTNPHVLYKKEWKGWGYVFNSDRKTWGNFLTYDEAKAYVQEHYTPKGIDVLERYKQQDLPDFLPSSPNEFYVGKGWIDSSDFFGTAKERVGVKKGFWPYKQAREWVRLNLRICGITTSKLYRAYALGILTQDNLPPRPPSLPIDPWCLYRCDGFSWGDFLGTLVVAGNKKKLFTYAECKEWNVINLKGQIKGRAEWTKYRRGGYPDLPPFPKKMPDSPYGKFTRSKEWKGWDDFLGVVTVKKVTHISNKERLKYNQQGRNYLSYAQARQYMIEYMVPMGIKSLRQYQLLKKKPANIPLDPGDYYKDKGWISACHFMGGPKAASAKYLSYAEAKEWVRVNFVPRGIDTLHKYTQHLKELPANMPPDPRTQYRRSGWVSVYDFMSIANPESRGKTNRKKDFWPVQEASAWITRNLPGIDSSLKWRAYLKGKFLQLPALPADIPRVPDITYSELGVWKGWASFLCTSNKRGRPKKNMMGLLKDGVSNQAMVA